MLNKIKNWLYWNAPIITTRKKREKYTEDHTSSIISYNAKLNRYFIKDIVISIKELRKNTWDIKRVDFIVAQLKSYFEVKDV